MLMIHVLGQSLWLLVRLSAQCVVGSVGFCYTLFGRHIVGGLVAAPRHTQASHGGHTGEGQPAVSVYSEGSQGRDLSGNQRVRV